MNSRSFRKWPI